MKLYFSVGNDNGNSEHDIIIDGKLIQQPNLYTKAKQVAENELTLDALIRNLQDELIVSLNSPSLTAPGLFKVGNYALQSGDSTRNMEVGTKKSESEVPIINTLARIAAVGVERAYEELKTLPDELEIVVDMATGLPIAEHTKETSSHFERQFIADGQKHRVTVHLGKHQRVEVAITFDYVKAIQEATPVTFTLQVDDKGNWREGEIFDEFAEEYSLGKIDGSHFKDKTIFHIDIGDGTTEYPITEGNKPLLDFKRGSRNGAGKALENALPEFIDELGLDDVPRQYLSEVLKQPSHKYHSVALDKIDQPAEDQAQQIMKIVNEQLRKKRYEVDVVTVYGGGSILLKNYLKPKLKEVCDKHQLQLFYVPTKYAITLNAEGLDIFVKSKIFETLKARSKQTV